MVSVAMAVYNRPDFLQEAINSILKQTYRNFEFLIIDDGSNNTQTIAILKNSERMDMRIKLIWLEKHEGLPYAMNIAYSLAQGKYIAKMDSDDISLPRRLERQVHYLENNADISVLVPLDIRINEFDEKGYWCRIYDNDRAIKFIMNFGNPIRNPAVMMRTEVGKTFLYNTSVRVYSDYIYWLEIVEKSFQFPYMNIKFAQIPEVLFMYR